MPDQKPVKSAFLLMFAVLAVAVAGGIYYFAATSEPTEPEAEEAAGIQPAASEIAEAQDEAETAQENTGAAVTGFPGNTEGPMGERTLGDPNAPVKITEYSSLTCGHCGAFHQNTLEKLKSEYIDTGKVFFRFVDFPLNAPALHATMAARCLPHERFYDFQQLLFKTQEDWAYDAGYMSYLRQNAQLAGLGEEEFTSCIRNDELQKFILERMTSGREAHGIQSTPSFAFDDGTVIRGAQPYEQFAQIIEQKLVQEEEPQGQQEESAE